MPVVLALLVGLVIPFIRDQLSDETTAERSGVVKVIDVQEGVPLGDFAAQHAAAPQGRQLFVLAAATDDVPEIEAQQVAPGDDGTDGATTDGETDGDDGTTTDGETDGEDGTTTDGETDGEDGTTTDGGTDGGGNDADRDGIADADDLCPTTKEPPQRLPRGVPAHRALRLHRGRHDRQGRLTTFRAFREAAVGLPARRICRRFRRRGRERTTHRGRGRSGGGSGSR
jgi:hypothetical protein